ncbi:hypothetical protein KC340_g17186 [Hortaea werneckii]|nr:hypothetical protein KC342_g1079 [Hortaea werneckii]KAI7107091.1 hypothetical protein KC339_g2615 [Hortaea werneckii]KAI7226333.1 hypothetical protein KC365_g9453 [Hortaea werneckii]KAI7291126.1 hypothetical protein KC340_g17186 [Hortaea werneckii]KAI7376847.1 hypothetical protein KC328_g14707 [Hortaea werneckii]
MRMLLRRYTWLATFNSILVHQAAAQSCYYPNGDLAEGMAACSGDGGACCPYQWECLSNGLCYLENADYYGRYTCTDQRWSNSTCPGLCTQENTASGNEAILQCVDGSWCCDGNRSFDCCEEADAVFFDLPDGTSIAYISSIPPASSATSSSSEDTTEMTTSSPLASKPTSFSSTETPSEVAETSTTAQPSQTTPTTPTTSSSTSPSTTEAPSTITSQAITTGTNGAASTLYIVSTVTPQPDPLSTPFENSSDDEPTSPDRALIIGIAVGLPTILLAIPLLAYLLWKRHRKSTNQRNQNGAPTTDYSSQGDLDEKFGSQVGHLPPDGRAPELDSYPVAMVQRSPSGRKSELEGSPSTTTTVSSPAISSLGGGGGTQGRTQFGGGGQSSPLSPGLQSVREEQQQQEPYELWGGYVPYRPPQSAQEVGKPGGGEGYHGDGEKPGMWQ